jgi:hypothetical protein
MRRKHTMRISGFTIARLTAALDYPLRESLQSLLPLVDELVVNVDAGDDATWAAVQAMGEPRIIGFRSEWDLGKRDGLTLSEETNKALQRCTGEWAVYLQADEVLHEAELPELRAALQRHHPSDVEALSLLYYHFYGSYSTYQDDPRRWYRRATRVVRTGVGIESVGDACAFMKRVGSGWQRPRRRDLGVHVYHYGRARHPALMLRKQRNLERYYHAEAWLAEHGLPADMDLRTLYTETDHLVHFTGTHPAVMKERIAAADWPAPELPVRRAPDWLRRTGVFAQWAISRTWARLTRRT